MEKNSNSALIGYLIFIIIICGIGIFYFATRSEDELPNEDIPVVPQAPEDNHGNRDLILGKINSLYDNCPIYFDKSTNFSGINDLGIIECLSLSPISYELSELKDSKIITTEQYEDLIKENNTDVELIEVNNLIYRKFVKVEADTKLKELFNIDNYAYPNCTLVEEYYLCGFTKSDRTNNIVYYVSDIKEDNSDYIAQVEICYFDVMKGVYNCANREYSVADVEPESGLTKDEYIAKEYGERYLYRFKKYEDNLYLYNILREN